MDSSRSFNAEAQDGKGGRRPVRIVKSQEQPGGVMVYFDATGQGYVRPQAGLVLEPFESAPATEPEIPRQPVAARPLGVAGRLVAPDQPPEPEWIDG